MSAEDKLPHSRACGILPHPHGPRCSRDCPTCRSQRVEQRAQDAMDALSQGLVYLADKSPRPTFDEEYALQVTEALARTQAEEERLVTELNQVTTQLHRERQDFEERRVAGAAQVSRLVAENQRLRGVNAAFTTALGSPPPPPATQRSWVQRLEADNTTLRTSNLHLRAKVSALRALIAAVVKLDDGNLLLAGSPLLARLKEVLSS